MNLSYKTFSTALAALRQMEQLHPEDMRWSTAAYDLRVAFLAEVARDLSGDMLTEGTGGDLSCLLRKQAG